jgi:sulfur transfer complex TusBCD TusB component (DsrH family)
VTRRRAAQVACLADDASMRGLATAGLSTVNWVGYGELVDLLVEAPLVVGAM